MTGCLGLTAQSSLDQLAEGSVATLIRVEGLPALRRRLMELGLLPGTSLRLVRRMDKGGVVELEVRHSRLSLRRNEAARLMVATG